MRRLPFTVYMGSAVFVAGLILLAGLSARALWSTTAVAETMALRQLDALRRTQRVEDLLFEKGYVSSYLATRDPRWLAELGEREKSTRQWLSQVAADASTTGQRNLVEQLRTTYEEYDGLRDVCLAAYRAGHTEEAAQRLQAMYEAMNRVLGLAHDLTDASRAELLTALEESRHVAARSQRSIALLAGIVSLLGVGFGVWIARRIARPIIELILRVEKAGVLDRIRVDGSVPGRRDRDELATLTRHVERLLGRLSEQQRRLVQAEKMGAVGEISAKLAHEILNPVAAVKAALQAQTRTAALPENVRAVMGEADRTLTRVSAIMQRLVQYSRPLEPRLQQAQVRQLIEGALGASAHELRAREVETVTEVPMLPPARVDPDLLTQVLTNLVVNAAQASPHGSRIVLRARRDPGALVLEVSDRGRGLPAARDKLFQPFFTTRERGNGLGLAVSKNIVAEHGGSIRARDGEGGIGAVFTVTLPQEGEAWAAPS